jgi:hypothetical protein
LFDSEIPEKDYFYQLQGYMELTGRDNAILAYTLMNTPQHLIERDARNHCFLNGYENLDIDIYHEFLKNMTYDNIEGIYRIKMFDFKKDETVISEIKDRVMLCRDYINSLIKTL